MKYNLGDKVRLKQTGKTGEIQHYKFDTYFVNKKVHELHRYYLYLGGHNFNWYSENEIEAIGEDDKFTPKFEIGLLNLLIDINLTSGNFDMVKWCNDEKVKLERGGK